MLFLALVVFPYLDAVRTLATNAAVTLHATAVVAAQQQEAPQPRALEGPCAASSSRTGEPSKKRIRRYESKRKTQKKTAEKHPSFSAVFLPVQAGWSLSRR